MRTSMVANTPVEVERDGYRVIRRGGRYAVFPQVALEGLRSGGKSEDALVEILTTPKNALVKQYQRLFEMENVRLGFSDDALRAIAHKAIDRKTGARGLRSILENILLETMFDLPTLEDVDECVVNKETVENRASPLFIYSDRRADMESSAG